MRALKVVSNSIAFSKSTKCQTVLCCNEQSKKVYNPLEGFLILTLGSKTALQTIASQQMYLTLEHTGKKVAKQPKALESNLKVHNNYGDGKRERFID